MIKKVLLTLGLGAVGLSAIAQNKFVFTDMNIIPHTPICDQGQSGTCWCFSTMSFLESEMMKNGMENPPNLSEMFVVRHNYMDRAKKYVMLQKNLNFSQGSYFLDNLKVMRDYGLVPEGAFPNLKDSEFQIDHSLLERELKAIVDEVADEGNEFVDSSWVQRFDEAESKYLNEYPAEFEYDGKTYTPKTFASDYCKLNYSDYIQVTSFSHHDFYKYIVLELPDNWRWSLFLNVKVDDLTTIIDNSLQQGHTVLWAADVSEPGFDTRRGYAVLPGIYAKDQALVDSFKVMTPEQQAKVAVRLMSPGIEVYVTQESRQADFLNRKTTDDHGMQIIGTAEDQFGNKYYKVKNSWGKYGNYDGYLYVSQSYVKAKTTGLMVNKCACKEFIKKAEIEW